MTPTPALPAALLDERSRAALAEDLGRAGDITRQAIVPPAARARAVIAAREPGVVAGLALAREAFRRSIQAIGFEAALEDGDGVAPGGARRLRRRSGAGRARGRARRLEFPRPPLRASRGSTARYAGRIAHTKAQVCDTRKTTPLLRALEKYAVRCGGGANHRFGLDDAVLIKDNHIAVAGGVGPALRRGEGLCRPSGEDRDRSRFARAARRGRLRIGVDAVLLDNMTIATMREAVALIAKRAVVEASGGVTLETIAQIAETGVDLISVGALTHSARALDLGLDVTI